MRARVVVILFLLLISASWSGMGNGILKPHDMSIRESVASDVPESSNYTTVYQLNIPDDGKFNSCFTTSNLGKAIIISYNQLV